jgi:hypothetical protein
VADDADVCPCGLGWGVLGQRTEIPGFPRAADNCRERAAFTPENTERRGEFPFENEEPLVVHSFIGDDSFVTGLLPPLRYEHILLDRVSDLPPLQNYCPG